MTADILFLKGKFAKKGGIDLQRKKFDGDRY